MTINTPPDEAPVPNPPARIFATQAWRTWVLLAAILLLSAYFNTINLFGWDGGTGQHPDERFMSLVADHLKAPSSLGEYLDSQRNPLNPRNGGYSFYVYGLLPQTLTHYTAVVFTPNSALPPTVMPASPTNYGQAVPVPNPDLKVPKLTLLQPIFNPSGKDLTSYYNITKVGRSWSALFATLSVLVVFLIGRRLYGSRTGLVAALLLALSVLPIQLAHFFTVDSATAFFTLLSVYCAVRLAQNGGWASALLLGLAIGAAMACRVTMATLGMLAVLALAQRLWAARDTIAPSSDSYYTPGPRRLSFLQGAGMLVLAGMVSLITFRLLQPDAFVGTSFFDIRIEPRFISNIQEIGAAVNGLADSPPSQQWVGRIRYWFALQNMVVWGMGVALGVMAWLAWAWAGIQLARAGWEGWANAEWARLRRNQIHLLPWFWVAFYFAWQGGLFGMTMRYYLQLYGLLALFAAWALVRALDFRLLISDWRPRRDRLYGLQGIVRWVPLVVVVGVTLAWAYAFTRIYTRPHSRITASRWMYEHIPLGSAVTAEQWDDGLPLSIDDRRAFEPNAGGWFYSVETYPYAEDDPTKYTGYIDQNGKSNLGLLDQLEQADYVVLSSNRVYGSATRLPMRYPALTRYYHYLFNGELGFEQVADITSYPTLFGVPIPDQGAEEAFSVYDHPRVLIFKKTPTYSRTRATQLITGDIAWSEVYKLSSLRGSRVPTALRLTDTQWQAYRDAGTWSSLFNPSGLANFAPWLTWLVVLELLGCSMFALLFRALPGLPDRGFALAKMLALLLVAYTAWLLGSLHLLAFGTLSTWLCAGILITAGALVGWRSRAALRTFLRERRAALLSAEGLFLVAYLGFVLIRALNPDLWHPARGGEKPMDLAFLTAVVKSPYFPPYDPWFAGGFINYYYFGFVIVGALVQLTGIAPAIAYNLAVPTLFALTALGAWGAIYNLLALRTAERNQLLSRPGYGATLGSRIERRAITTGLLAAALIVVIGPLTQALWLLPGSAKTDPTLPAECQALSSYASQQQCRDRDEWAFWDATRLVGMDVQDSTINEFPFFTFLFADLHAHMIALPLAMLALGLMVAVLKAENARANAKARSYIPTLVCLGALALTIGALRATNTWDFPTYLALGCVTLGLIAWRNIQRGASLPHTALVWIGAVLWLLVGSTLLFLPFLRSFATDYAGFELWRGARTPAADMLRMNGLWLFFLVSGAVLLYWRRGAGLPLLLLIGLGPVVLALVTVLQHANALFLMLPLAAAAIAILFDHLLERRARPTAGHTALAGHDSSEPYVHHELPLLTAPRPDELVAPPATETETLTPLPTLLAIVWGTIALLIALATEIVVAKGDIGRMNTVFKFGMQSWVLFALASALALSIVWSALEARRRLVHPVIRWVWQAVAVLLLAGGLMYPITAIPARLADRIDSQIGPTLDGVAFMRSAKGSWAENNQQFDFTEDATALAWMQQNIVGTPIVLEAQTEAYRWGGRVSTYTGLPTLLGWPWHETQQRQVAEVGPVLAGRQAFIQQIYSDTNSTTTLQQLQLYGIEYVYVGKLERALYPAQGLAKFETLAGEQQIERVYSSDTTNIYRIPRGGNAPVVLSTTLATTPTVLSAPRDTRLTAPVFTFKAVREYAWNTLAQSEPVAIVLWLLALYVILALGFPLAALLFGGLAVPRHGAADGGWAWARLVGLLLLGYAVWMPVSMGLWAYTRWSLLWGLLLVLAANIILIFWLGRRTDAASDRRISAALGRGWTTLRAHVLSHWRAMLITEALFLAAFTFMAVLRAFNPDLWQPFWGGEKPFEFGLLNAILRSPMMPPYDPFFSDGAINYYYYGLFLASVPIKATGINPAVGFNLVIATLFAFTFIGAFAVVARLSGRLRYGLVGSAFVVLLGNLAAAFPVGWGQGLGPVREALQGGLSGFGERLGSWFVGPSRVIASDKLMTINEFPFWSYLFADLHPHLIAMPIALLCIALAFELFEGWPLSYKRRGWLPLAARWGLAALALGALAITNSWDLPTYALLIAGAVAGRAWRTRTPTRRFAAFSGGLAQAAGIVLGALLLYLPFFQNYVRPAGVTGIGLVRDGSPLSGYVLIYGLYLLILSMWVGGIATRLLNRRHSVQNAVLPPAADTSEQNMVLGIVARPPTSSSARMLGTFLMIIGLLLAGVLLTNQGARDLVGASSLLLKVGLILLLAASAPALLSRRLPRRVWFVLWLAVLAWAVSLGIEFVYIRDHLDGPQSDAYRMNTVFKFGLQAWMLMALAAAAALPWLARGLRRAGVVAQTLGWAMMLVLLALALVFPLVGIPSRLAYRFPESPDPTLDGLEFMQQAQFDLLPEYIGQPSGGPGTQISLKDDLDAIRWLNENVRGSQIVLQSDLWFYRAYGVRIAANTGLPTIVSPLHASEQHDPTAVDQRDGDVQLIYNTPDIAQALRLLAKYHVSYVYVGQIERAAYSAAGIAKFDQMAGSYLRIAYNQEPVQGTVKIFKVNPSVYTFTSGSDIVPPPKVPDLQPQAETPSAPQQPANQPSLAELEQQVRNNPTDTGVVFGLAQRYRELQRNNDALAILQGAAARNPSDVALQQLYGDTLRDAGEFDAAVQAYEAAIAADGSAGNYNKLGNELLKMKRLPQAIEALNKAINADANAAEPHYHLGEVYEQQGKLTEAQAEYRAYLLLANPDAPYYTEASDAVTRLQK